MIKAKLCLRQSVGDLLTVHISVDKKKRISNEKQRASCFLFELVAWPVGYWQLHWNIHPFWNDWLSELERPHLWNSTLWYSLINVTKVCLSHSFVDSLSHFCKRINVLLIMLSNLETQQIEIEISLIPINKEISTDYHHYEFIIWNEWMSAAETLWVQNVVHIVIRRWSKEERYIPAEKRRTKRKSYYYSAENRLNTMSNSHLFIQVARRL